MVHVAIERGRTLQAPARTRFHRTSHLAEKVKPGSSPPRVRLEDAVIEVMADRLARDDVLTARPRVVGRVVLEGLLADLRDGACSVLERGYLHRVERAHGLPRATRQATSTVAGKKSVTDVRYDELGLVVELDGRSFHDTPEAYDADATRDLAEKAFGETETVRVTYGMVFGDACRTARWIAQLLGRLGWTGRMCLCPSCPRAAERVA